MRSTIERRCRDCSFEPRFSSSSVAVMAPQLECPSTTTSRSPKRSAANSTLPICEGATMLPATRITNRSPEALVENDLRGHAGIRTTEDDREGRLALGDRPATHPARERVVAARFLDVALVTFAQALECLLR